MIHLMYPDGQRVKLRWTDQHASSSYGLGVVLIGPRGTEILDGATFGALAADGARIECDTDLERRRVAGALAWAALDLPDDALVVA